MSERPTFSPFWHRVRAMKPRLRPHVQITRQHYRGQRWHVVHDPATNNFFRLSPIAHEYVSLLDGKRTVEEVWHLALTRHADDAPTQNEAIQLLSQLYNSNLLSVEASPEVEQLLGRGRERTKKKIQQQAIGLMYFRIKLFNPDRVLSHLEPILRPILNRWGFFAWCAFVLFGLFNVLPEWDELRNGVGSALAPSNWGWMIAVFVVVKLVHETGHGVICRRFGGQVPEFGVMMLVLLPAPYVDASACWAFPSKWQRIAVGAGGMIFELFVASIAALVWTATKHSPGLAHQLAYNAMLTASVSTVLFNANPLMRFDGYYILADLLEVPNLMQRSTQMLKYLAHKLIYRVRDANPPSSSRSEQTILVVYGAAAMTYRVFLFFSITLYVMGKMFAIGMILAAWTAAMWFILPVGGFIHWLATGNQIAEFRTRAVLTSLALAVLVVLGVGVIPAPDRRRAEGVVEGEARSGIYFGEDGFVTTAHARPGDRVSKGDPIVTLESPELRSDLEGTRARLAEAEAMERAATMKDEGQAQVARDRIQTLRGMLGVLQGKVAKLVVRAPHDGVVVGEDPVRFVGSYAKAGKQLCEVVDAEHLRVAATLTQSEASWLIALPREDYRVEMRAVSRVGDVVDGGGVRVVEAGQRELPHAALGFSGGGTIETEQKDQRGTVAKNPLFKVFIDPAPGSKLASAEPGERVSIRFSLPAKPLLAQWVDRLHKLIQGRVDV